MGIMRYAWPEEGMLQGIICIIWCLALYVLARCLILRQGTRKNLQLIEELQDVSFLESVLRMNNVDIGASFANYKQAVCEKLKNNASDLSEEACAPLFEHLQAIYVAGHKSSRLDADLLVKNTVSKIFRETDTLRSYINLFLVFGILGTLLGLAISIGTFAGSDFAINIGTSAPSGTQATKAIGAQLSSLFRNLRGAFAPSIWGVFCTIFFVFFFSKAIQEGCINRLTEKLTNSTLNKWLPVLYPTDFQKSENSIVKLNDTIRNAEGINTGANALLQNLSAANESVAALKDVSEAVRDSGAAFGSGAEKVERLSETLSALATQARNENEGFNAYMAQLAAQNKTSAGELKEGMSSALAAMEAQLREQSQGIFATLKLLSEQNGADSAALKEILQEQAQQLAQVIKTLKIYEESSLKSRDAAQDAVLKALAALESSAVNVKGAADAVLSSEAQVVNAVAEPLRKELAQQLRDIGLKINQAAVELQRINSPLSEATKKMDSMFNNFARSFNDLINKLGEKAGLNAEERRQIMSAAEDSNAKVLQELEKIRQVLQERRSEIPAIAALPSEGIAEKLEAVLANMGGSSAAPYSEKSKGFPASWQKYAPAAVGAFLAISIILQGMMAFQLSRMQDARDELRLKPLEASLELNAAAQDAQAGK